MLRLSRHPLSHGGHATAYDTVRVLNVHDLRYEVGRMLAGTATARHVYHINRKRGNVREEGGAGIERGMLAALNLHMHVFYEDSAAEAVALRVEARRARAGVKAWAGDQAWEAGAGHCSILCVAREHADGGLFEMDGWKRELSPGYMVAFDDARFRFTPMVSADGLQDLLIVQSGAELQQPVVQGISEK